jgi:hypothetical protein
MCLQHQQKLSCLARPVKSPETELHVLPTQPEPIPIHHPFQKAQTQSVIILDLTAGAQGKCLLRSRPTILRSSAASATAEREVGEGRKEAVE